MSLLTNIRWRTILSLAIILPIGLLYSHYRYSTGWLNQEVGGIFYEIFWCLFAFLFITTHSSVWQIPLWVLDLLQKCFLQEVGKGKRLKGKGKIPNLSPFPLPLFPTYARSLLVITCLLEFLQLWHSPFLNLVRSFWWGKMLIGSAFTWAKKGVRGKGQRLNLSLYPLTFSPVLNPYPFPLLGKVVLGIAFLATVFYWGDRTLKY